MTAVRAPSFLLCFVLAGCTAGEGLTAPDPGLQYLEDSLLAAPLQPGDRDAMSIDCDLQNQPVSPDYRLAFDVDYGRAGWEQRVASDWEFFKAPASEGALTVIDFRRVGNALAYRYLANASTHDQLYEPWSTSKIQAFTTAVSTLRRHGIGADASVGGVALSDLITSINSYAPSGRADGNSNAIATYLLNIAGRDYATALFHSGWLNLANENIRFRGAYGPTAFAPPANEFVSADQTRRYTPEVYGETADDPGYLTYRCERCGIKGNKAMTALAQAEWLKRLASHRREPSTQHPHLQTSDVETLFYGGRSFDGEAPGGMLAGISTFLPEALAQALDADTGAKQTLDRVTRGRWRVYQKVGWGPSETRGTSELVMLAHVCLPAVGGNGREFTLVARAAVDGAAADESGVGRAGIKLRALLDRSLPQLLRAQEET